MKKITFTSITKLLVVFLLLNSCTKSNDTNETAALNIPGPNIVDIDDNIYQSVSNCGITFTKQNLNVSKYNDGTPIPEVTDPTQWTSLTTGAWCYFYNNSANGPIYGKLYNWYAVVGIYDDASAANPALRKKLAPNGWHIPTDDEWTSLSNCLGGLNVAGGKIKEKGTLHWISPNTAATNESGFTGLPGGCRDDFDGSFGINNGYWWSSSGYDLTNAWSFSLGYDNGRVCRATINKKLGFSVRCVKD